MPGPSFRRKPESRQFRERALDSGFRRNDGLGYPAYLVTAPSEADDTSLAYLAMTPLA